MRAQDFDINENRNKTVDSLLYITIFESIVTIKKKNKDLGGSPGKVYLSFGLSISFKP